MNTTEILNEINDPGTRRSLQIMFDKLLTENGTLVEGKGNNNTKTVKDSETIQSVIDSITDASINNPYEVAIPANRANESWVDATHITVITNGHAVGIPAYADENAAIKGGLAGDRFYHVAGDAKILAKKVLIMKDADADQAVDIVLSLPTGKNLVIDHGDTNSTNVSGPQSETTYTVTYSDALAHEILISGDLNSITYFKITGEPISKTYNIHYLTSLVYLYLHNNSLTDIGTITNLTNLANLNLSNNSLTDIGTVTNLTSLVYLNLPGNSLTDIGTVTNLTSLVNLKLYSNSFSSTELSDYIDQAWTNRVALGALSCVIKIESNDSTPSCDADAVAKIEGNAPYTGDGLIDAGCTVTYDA